MNQYAYYLRKPIDVTGYRLYRANRGDDELHIYVRNVGQWEGSAHLKYASLETYAKKHNDPIYTCTKLLLRVLYTGTVPEELR